MNHQDAYKLGLPGWSTCQYDLLITLLLLYVYMFTQPYSWNCSVCTALPGPTSHVYETMHPHFHTTWTINLITRGNQWGTTVHTPQVQFNEKLLTSFAEYFRTASKYPPLRKRKNLITIIVISHVLFRVFRFGCNTMRGYLSLYSQLILVEFLERNGKGSSKK